LQLLVHIVKNDISYQTTRTELKSSGLHRGVIMAFWKVTAIFTTFIAQSVPSFAQQPASSQNAYKVPDGSCLKAAGALGSADIQAVQSVDGKTLRDVSDIRSLRSKAKDGKTIVINGGDFSGKKFGNDNFSNICFLGTNLSNTRWSKSRADGAGFIDTNLTGATFDRVSLTYVLFRNATLAKADASGAKLSYGQLDGGWDTSMAGLRLENAQMMGFRFQCGTSSSDGCSFDRKQINLRGANLSGASLSSFSVWDANLVDVILNNTEIALDQIPQYANAHITGPLLVRSASKRASLSPEAFRIALVALSADSASSDTECNNPDTPLLQIFCQTGQSSLRTNRDDVNRLYESMSIRSAKADGTIITVTAPGKDQDKYLTSLRKCALKGEDVAITCITEKMAKRRAVLVAALSERSPLEQDARALFVSAETPLVKAVSRDPRLASLTPLLIGAAPKFLLAYRDDDNLLNARGVSQSADGAQCTYGFAPVGDSKSRKTKPAAKAFMAWSSGAEFFVLSNQKSKKKKTRKVKKSKNGKVLTVAEIAPNPTQTGCSPLVQSGPLVRLPILEDDFDRLWAAQKTKV
jgi:uncharacterized protein YjbI with pentapeptide repeats